MENNKTENQNNQYDIISFSKGFVSPNMPIVTLTQEGKEYNFIIDTGSDENVINEVVLQSLKYKTLNDKHSLIGLGGKQVTNACEITMTGNDKEYTFKYLIANLSASFQSIKKECGIEIHGLLGSKYLREYGFVLDFAQLVAYNKK